ncbi:MAG: hypothetical protein M3460_17435 [Actinomycetota bacterium]|nr:hypothetical protein [Actinomycetota bacterium]
MPASEREEFLQAAQAELERLERCRSAHARQDDHSAIGADILFQLYIGTDQKQMPRVRASPSTFRERILQGHAACRGS